MHDPQKLAMYFRNLKEKRNLTQVEMADLAGVGQSTISNMLNAKHIQARSVEKIALALGVNLRELYQFTEALPPIKTHSPNGQLSEEYIDHLIIDGLRRLSPTSKAKALHYINTLLDK